MPQATSLGERAGRDPVPARSGPHCFTMPLYGLSDFSCHQRSEVHQPHHVPQERCRDSYPDLVCRKRRKASFHDREQERKIQAHPQQSAGQDCALHDSGQGYWTRISRDGAHHATRRIPGCSKTDQRKILACPCHFSLAEYRCLSGDNSDGSLNCEVRTSLGLVRCAVYGLNPLLLPSMAVLVPGESYSVPTLFLEEKWPSK
jgi:hypothetical protein